MKKLALVIFAVVAALNMGCQPKNNSKTRVTARSVRGGAAPSQNVAPNAGSQQGAAAGTQWGQVVQFSGQSQQQFQMAVAGFVSNLSEPDGTTIGLGTVSGQSGQNTGIRFYGSIQSNGSQISSGSLRISIVDSYVGQPGADGTITEIPIYIAPGVEGFQSVSGSISGTSATVHFTDSFGTITLQGSFSGQWFSGNMYYSNSFQWMNGRQQTPGSSGPLGAFAVPTCGFFKC